MTPRYLLEEAAMGSGQRAAASNGTGDAHVAGWAQPCEVFQGRGTDRSSGSRACAPARTPRAGVLLGNARGDPAAVALTHRQSLSESFSCRRNTRGCEKGSLLSGVRRIALPFVLLPGSPLTARVLAGRCMVERGRPPVLFTTSVSTIKRPFGPLHASCSFRAKTRCQAQRKRHLMNANSRCLQVSE